MNIRITYCKPCRFWGQALQDADTILNAHGTQVDSLQLVAGDNGVYTIEVDGKEVFSKAKVDRFPETEETRQLVASA